MFITDTQKIGTRKVTDEGYLSVTAKISRAGMQDYFVGVDELADPKTLPDYLTKRPIGSAVTMFRPRGEVFNHLSMDSFKHLTMTNDHPTGSLLNAGNLKGLHVGISKDITRSSDGVSLDGELLIQDAEAIADIKGGKDEISLGYTTDIVWEAGTDAEFGAYDAKFTNIRGNHIAIVDNARAGSSYRINDKLNNKIKESELKMSERTRVIDNKSINLSEDAAQVFDDLIEKVSDATESDVLIEELKAEIEKLKGELAAMKSQEEPKPTEDEAKDEAIQEAVKDHMLVLGKAMVACDSIDFSGMNVPTIKSTVIDSMSKKTIDCTDKSADYIDGVFETFTKVTQKKEVTTNTPIGDALKGTEKVVVEDARARMIKRRNGVK